MSDSGDRYGIAISVGILTFEPRSQRECDEAVQAVHDALVELGYESIYVEAQRVRREDGV